MNKITDFVRDNNRAYFIYFRQGVFYYTVKNLETEDNYMFPVPIADIGDATLNQFEKAMILKRYIRKAIDDKTLVPV